MKILVLVLFLANLLMYAVGTGRLGNQESADAGRLNQQVSPEKIVILKPGQPRPPVEEKPEAGEAGAAAADAGEKSAEAAKVETAKPEAAKPEPAKAEAPKPEPAKAEAPKEAAKPELAKAAVKLPEEGAQGCRAWDKLSLLDVERLSAFLAGKYPDYQQVRKPSGGNDGANWWVYIPTLADKAEADRKAGELRNFGVSDFFVVQEGPNRNAISLGIFSIEKGAQERLAELKGRGVRSARIGTRPGKEGFFALEVSGPEAGMSKVLAGMSKQVKSPPQNCP